MRAGHRRFPRCLKLYRSKRSTSSGAQSVAMKRHVSSTPESQERTGRDSASRVRLASARPAYPPRRQARPDPACTMSSTKITDSRSPRTSAVIRVSVPLSSPSLPAAASRSCSRSSGASRPRTRRPAAASRTHRVMTTQVPRDERVGQIPAFSLLPRTAPSVLAQLLIVVSGRTGQASSPQRSPATARPPGSSVEVTG